MLKSYKYVLNDSLINDIIQQILNKPAHHEQMLYHGVMFK